MNPTRRQTAALLGGLIAAPAILPPLSARAADFTYKFANNQPLHHPINVRAKEAAERIKAETNGRFVLEIFPSSSLGSDTALLGQIRSGGVEFFTLAGAILATIVPVATIENVPFAFRDYPTVWKTMDGPLGQYVRDEIAKINVIALDRVWDNGFMQMTSNVKPLKVADDMKGLKVRTGPSPLQVSMCQALGASPTSLNFSELYTALQTGVVDAQMNALVIIEANKLNEVQKYCSITNHMWSGFWMLANRRAWDRLPADVRDVVAKHLNTAAVAERADVEAGNAPLREKLTKAGMAFNEAETASFREALAKAGFYADWKKKLG